jgi:hypothetical protein
MKARELLARRRAEGLTAADIPKDYPAMSWWTGPYRPEPDEDPDHDPSGTDDD